MTPVAYVVSVGLGLAATTLLVARARRHPGHWANVAAMVLGGLLAADALSFLIARVAAGSFSARTDLPLALCDTAVLVAALACWSRLPVLVELTWFWGLAGTLQAVITPDLSAGFPHLVFFQYVVGHVGIVAAALFLVVGLRIRPRHRAVTRVLAITLGYTALVGLVDALAGANYMFLRHPPARWSLLSVLGPWPWYLVGAAGVALALFGVLDAPFRRSRYTGTRPVFSARASASASNWSTKSSPPPQNPGSARLRSTIRARVSGVSEPPARSSSR